MSNKVLSLNIPGNAGLSFASAKARIGSWIDSEYYNLETKQNEPLFSSSFISTNKATIIAEFEADYESLWESGLLDSFGLSINDLGASGTWTWIPRFDASNY